MRPPSVLVPGGSLIAAVGISMPILTAGVRAPGSLIPGLSDVVSAVPDKGLGASTDQRVYLYAVVALAVGAWLVPKLATRLMWVGVALASVCLAVVTVATYRGWVLVTEGPQALVNGNSSFVERAALTFLAGLHAGGLLVLHPARGLWILSAGAAVALAGVVLMFRRPPDRNP